MQAKLSKDNFEKLKEFIYRKSGIYLNKEQDYIKLLKYIDKRFASTGIGSFNEYFFTLRFDDKKELEFQELINHITINDTYFFRDNEQFEVLVEDILEELNDTLPKDRPIKILSSPCSSGEEVYSILLHIKNIKSLHGRDIEILGIDIDSNMIDQAQKGIYDENSVRLLPKEILLECFTKEDNRYNIDKSLSKNVEFRLVNVFDKELMNSLGSFDVIFSRNMFVYFDDISRKEVANTFYEILNKDGYVVLSNTEHMSRVISTFKTKKVKNTMLYQKL